MSNGVPAWAALVFGGVALTVGGAGGAVTMKETMREELRVARDAASSAKAPCRDWAIERWFYQNTGCPHPQQTLSIELNSDTWVKCTCRRDPGAKP